MKVVYILTTSKGGISHYTAELANAVSKYAEVFVIKPKKTDADDIFAKEVKIINAFEPLTISFVDIFKLKVFSLNNLRSIFHNLHVPVSKLLRKINPDIVHFPDFSPQARIFTPAICKQYPVIITLHDVIDWHLALVDLLTKKHYKDILLLPLMFILNSLLETFFKVEAKKIIVHTQANKKTLLKKGKSEDGIVVIPHGIYNFFQTMGNIEKEEENVVLLFGNIVPDKGLDVLVEAAPMLVKELPSIKVIIAGDGIIPRESKKIIEKYNYNFEIYNRFIKNEEVSRLFSRASLVVYPAKSRKGYGEGYSGSLTIACSFGKPIVATDVGEFQKLLKERGCGLIIPPDDPKTLAEAIIKLLRNECLRKKMGKKASLLAEELSWDNIAKMHIKVYKEVVNENNIPTCC